MSIFLFLIMGSLLGVFVFSFRRERRFRQKLEAELAESKACARDAKARLEEGKARLESTFSGMAEGVLLTDKRGDILHANPAFQRMFALSGKVRGRSMLAVLASVAADDAVHEVLEKGEAIEREIEFPRPVRRIFQVHFSPVRRDEKLTGVVSVFHDLTEIRRLEAVRRDFIANLSHEFKTPLTAISGSSETLLAESGSHSAEHRRYLEVIFRNASELNRLVENLLNLSRIESGKEELRLEKIPLKDFVEGILERFRTAAELKGIELVQEIHETAGLQADPGKLNQILSNLVDNAVKYTPESGRVCVRGEERQEGVSIEVEDNGPGIPAEDQERIFERFYRVDKARARHSGGTGLGLAIAKHLTELHGGRISAASTPGRGSKFGVTFPSPS